MHDPWGALAEDVRVEMVDLPDDLDGYCVTAERRIVVARGMTQAERRVVICHESVQRGT